MKNTWTILVDCNNFFASCERLFRPDLIDKPIVVLSNNDGCVIARSKEAKEIGIPMGAPYFKFKAVLAKYRVQVFSTNFPLYGDISDRVFSVLAELTPNIEPYSIDEAFVTVPAQPRDSIEKLVTRIERTIQTHIGIPVSAGAARTKTLAKIAAERAKHGSRTFVLNTDNEQETHAILNALPAGAVWGIGGNSAATLRRLGIHTAWELREAPDHILRPHLGIRGVRTAWELRGIPCLTEESEEGKRAIMSSRAFGRDVSSDAELKEALAYHVEKAAQKMRAQGSAARYVSISIRTARHRDVAQYSGHESKLLPAPCADTLELIKTAHRMLATIYRPDCRYYRAGVTLGDFYPIEHSKSPTLFDDSNTGDRLPLMHALDALQHKYGQHAVRPASVPLNPTWKSRHAKGSPHYVTNWSDLPQVR